MVSKGLGNLKRRVIHMKSQEIFRVAIGSVMSTSTLQERAIFLAMSFFRMPFVII